MERPLPFGIDYVLNNAVMPEKAAFFHIQSASVAYFW